MNVTYAADFEKLFPALTSDELANLEENNLDDEKHDRVPPVVVWQDDEAKRAKRWIVADGHHTHKARTKFGLKIKYAKMHFETRDEALNYARRAQIGRRNLDPSQVAIHLAKLAPKAPRGGNHQKDQLDTLPNREELAEEHGIGRTTMKRADRVVEHGAKAVVEAVQQGTVSVSDAAAVADLPKREQVAALAKVKSGEAKTLREAAQQPASPPAPPEDKAGNKLPDSLKASFETGDAIRSIERKIGALVTEITKLATPADGILQKPGTERTNASAIKVARKDLKAAIYVGLPHAVCPYCKGRGCDKCDKLGWIHKDRWDGIPEERRGAK